MTKESEIENLLSNLDRVQESFEEVKKSEDELLDTESEILGAILEQITPLIEHIGDYVETQYYHPGGQFADSTTEYSNTKGIFFLSTYEEKNEVQGTLCRAPFRERPDGDQNRGIYDGTAIYLMETGKLMAYQFKGRWSNWQGESTDREAVEISTMEVNDILKFVDLDDVLQRIQDEFEGTKKEIGNKKKYLGKRRKLVAVMSDILSL